VLLWNMVLIGGAVYAYGGQPGFSTHIGQLVAVRWWLAAVECAALYALGYFLYARDDKWIGIESVYAGDEQSKEPGARLRRLAFKVLAWGAPILFFTSFLRVWRVGASG
jgi:hypothetical protein